MAQGNQPCYSKKGRIAKNFTDSHQLSGAEKTRPGQAWAAGKRFGGDRGDLTSTRTFP